MHVPTAHCAQLCNGAVSLILSKKTPQLSLEQQHLSLWDSCVPQTVAFSKNKLAVAISITVCTIFRKNLTMEPFKKCLVET